MQQLKPLLEFIEEANGAAAREQSPVDVRVAQRPSCVLLSSLIFDQSGLPGDVHFATDKVDLFRGSMRLCAGTQSRLAIGGLWQRRRPDAVRQPSGITAKTDRIATTVNFARVETQASRAAAL